MKTGKRLGRIQTLAGMSTSEGPANASTSAQTIPASWPERAMQTCRLAGMALAAILGLIDQHLFQGSQGDLGGTRSQEDHHGNVRTMHDYA